MVDAPWPSFDPVELGELAAALRDGTWLEARLVPGGVAQRVRVVALVIYRDREAVTFEQYREIADLFDRLSFTVDAEEVWWIKPTAVESVSETAPFHPTGQLQSEDVYFDCAVEAVAKAFGRDPEAMRQLVEAELGTHRERYWVMLVDSQLRGDQWPVLKRFGYRSPQPFVTARDFVSRNGLEGRILTAQNRARKLMAARR